MKRLVCVALLCSACAPDPREAEAKLVQVPSVHKDANVELAHDVAMLATGHAASSSDLDRLRAASFSRDAYQRYIDELVQRPGLGDVAVQALRVRVDLTFPTIVRTGAVLHTKTVGDKPIYYTTHPCEPEAAVLVEPWWDMGSRILICRDSYRPDVFWSGANACSGQLLAPMKLDSPCGCGPNLIRCFKNDADRGAAQQSVFAERATTLAYVVNHDLPLQDAFTSGNSFRSAINEFLYQRWRIENREVRSLRELPDWRQWPKEGQWAPRYEMRAGQHAGLFTSPNTFDTVRQRLVDVYDVLLCIQPDSSNVTTQAMLQIQEKHGADLRSALAGWEDLAKRPVCTNCHARMDYGSQFFSGWNWWYISTHYIAAAQKDTPGPLYINNIDDPRGTAKRNPAGFMQLVLQQPEFPMCMAQDLERYAFGTRTSSALHALDDTLQDIVRNRGTFRQLMRATLSRYVDDALTPPKVAPGRDLSAFVEEHCARCHDAKEDVAPGVILRGGNWCADAARCSRVAIDALVAVTFDRMPKDHRLDDEDKRHFLDLLAPLAWPHPEDRRHALRYFRDVPYAASVHGTTAILSRGTGSANVSAAPQLGGNNSFSTGLAAIVSLAAVQSCGDDATCIAQLLDPQTFEK